VDVWVRSIDPDDGGQGIANNLIKNILPLTKKAGFKYGTIEATSAFTSKAALFNGRLFETKSSQEVIILNCFSVVHSAEVAS